MKRTALITILFLVLGLPAGQVFAKTGPGNTVVAEDRERSRYDEALGCYNSGKYEKAIRLLKEYVKKNPTPEAYYLIAYSLYKLGRHDEANKYFKYSFIVEPSYSPTPGLEERHRKPLDEARPGRGGMGQRAARPPAIPLLIENRPSPGVRPGPESAAPQPAAPPRTKMEAWKPPVPAQPTTTVPPPTTTVSQPATTVPPPTTTVSRPATTVPRPATGGKPLPAPSATQPGTREPAETSTVKRIISKVTVPLENIIFGDGGLADKAEEIVARVGMINSSALLEEAAPLLEGVDPALLMPAIGIAFLLYLFFSYCLYRIASKLRVLRAWLAWVPLLQLWIFISSADKSPFISLLLFFALFIPVVNLLVAFYIWICIIHNTGRSRFLGLLTFLPVINIFLVLYIVFAEVTRRTSSEKDMLDMPDVSGEPDIPGLDFDLDEE